MNPVHLALGAAIVVLAIIGLCWVLARVADGLERAWDWLSWRFRGDDEDDYTDGGDDDPLVAELVAALHEELDPLPPERSWAELTEDRPTPRLDWTLQHAPHWEPARERRAPWWEVQQRAAYESLGLDYPSGLLARVREAGQ